MRYRIIEDIDGEFILQKYTWVSWFFGWERVRGFDSLQKAIAYYEAITSTLPREVWRSRR